MSKFIRINENDIVTKRCSKCKKYLPMSRDYFYRDKHNASGFVSRCRFCEGNSYALSGRYGLFDVRWAELEAISGIYKITCEGNNKIYIGSAVNFCMRWSVHVSALRKNKHENSYIQNTFNKYGFDSFRFEFVEFVEDVDKLIEREQYWLDFLKPYHRKIGFNILKHAGSSLGNKVSEETKQKLRKIKGKCINQYDLKGNLIATFDSANYASKMTEKAGSGINHCANGKKLTFSGSIWLYIDEEETIEQRLVKIEANTRKIIQYDLDGNFVKEWTMKVSEMAKTLGKEYLAIPNNVMGDCLSVVGFMWRYREGNDELIQQIESYQSQFDRRKREGNNKRAYNFK